MGDKEEKVSDQQHSDLKELIDQRFAALYAVIDERDSRYQERFKAMDEKTGLALTASEKAVTKAEIATEKRFDSVNEFRETLRDQASLLMPRSESEARYRTFEEKIEDNKKDIANLRETRSQSIGKDLSQNSQQLQNHWIVGILISVFFSIVALALTMISILKK